MPKSNASSSQYNIISPNQILRYSSSQYNNIPNNADITIIVIGDKFLFLIFLKTITLPNKTTVIKTAFISNPFISSFQKQFQVYHFLFPPLTPISFIINIPKLIVPVANNVNSIKLSKHIDIRKITTKDGSTTPKVAITEPITFACLYPINVAQLIAAD